MNGIIIPEYNLTLDVSDAHENSYLQEFYRLIAGTIFIGFPKGTVCGVNILRTMHLSFFEKIGGILSCSATDVLFRSATRGHTRVTSR